MPLKPPTMFLKRKVLTVAVAAVAFAGFGSLALAQTTPAKADPTITLVAVGSDTIQDVYNSFATTFGGNLLGSYNATNPVTGAINEIITPVDGTAGVNCSFARPNGSSQGRDALRKAINPNTTNAGKAIAPFPQVGCVDIARSSSGPDIVGTTPATDLQYVPFALDAVSGATGPATCAGTADNCAAFMADLGNGTQVSVSPVATSITQANLFTIADLHALYNCGTATEGGVTYWPQGSPTAQPPGSQVIDLYQPQPGSGTRSFWEGAAAINYPDASPCVHDHIINGPLATAITGGAPVEEHDGTAVATDTLGYGPFSIAQFISQQNPTHNPRIHDAALQNINGVSPFVTPGTPSSGLNTSFPITRDVFSVVKLSRLSSATDPLNTLLSGVGSSVCSQKSIIKSFGFALLAGTTCGETVPNFEAAG